MINTLGGAFGGYGLYLVKSKPVFTYVQLTAERFRWEGPDARARQAHHRVRLQDTTERGFGKGGTGVLSVDGKAVDSKKMPYSIPFIVSMDESFDVGVDTRYGVDDNDYQPPFRFTGKLAKLTITTRPAGEDCRGKELRTEDTGSHRTQVSDGVPRTLVAIRAIARALQLVMRHRHERELYETAQYSSLPRVGIAVLAMLVGDLQAQQVPIPQTAAEVPGPTPGPMTKAYVQMVGAHGLRVGVASRLCL